MLLNIFRQCSIRRKLVVLFLVMSLVTAITVALPMAVFDLLGIRRSMTADMATLADVLAGNSTAALTFQDAKSAQEMLEALRAESTVTAACIYDAESHPLAKYVRDGPISRFVPPPPQKQSSRFTQNRLIQFRDISLHGESIGSIYIESDLQRVNRRFREYILVFGATLSLALAFSVLLAHILQHPISHPLATLVSAAQAVSKANDYTIRVKIPWKDEFGMLGSTFNRMLDQIQKRDEQLLQHRQQLEQTIASRTAELVVSNAQLKRAEEKYRSIFEDAVIGIFQITPNGSPISINRALAQIHGYDSSEHFMAEVKSVPEQLFVDRHRLREMLRIVSEQDAVRSIEVQVYRRDRSRKWILANMRAVRDSDGSISLLEGTIEDITERKQAQEQVQYLAYYDALTGLANRTLLYDRMSKALASAQRRGEKLALLFLDLDRFKIINDSLGHSFGDLLLQQVAERLKAWARDQDTVARVGGDEFLIALTGIKDFPDVAVAAERVMDAMTREFVIQERRFHVNCSIGISIYPEHGADSEALIKNADAAMYVAKENGRNAYRFFSEDMNAQVMERMTMEHGLRAAMEKQELFLVYQPQVEIGTGHITGFEALLRWNHPELGLVSPERFIRVAENSGLIIPIGEWVLKTACSTAKSWRDRGLLTVPVAVNVSAIQFRQEGFLETVKRVLRETGLQPEYLELELTESVLMSNVEVARSVLQALREIGLRLAIDDFGTGYSSLAYLKHFPVGKLKIDRSFVRRIPANADDAAIAAAIISLAKSLNLKVIAEGVENQAQLLFLGSHNCDEAQGFLISQPIPPDEVAEKLRSSPFFALAVPSTPESYKAAAAGVK
jgi:diguanylate cyclase (GGDEF)-like protein/PAS domain S-box-containing protein